MLSYCLECEKNTESINSKISKTSNRIIIFSFKYEVCNSKELSRLVSQLGIRTPLNKIQLLGDIIF